MAELLVIILDLVAAAAVCAIAFILYRKFVVPSPNKDRIREAAYEEGFRDAVKYFGLKKLYADDPLLKERMSEVFSEVGVPHKYGHVIENVHETEKTKEPRSRTLGG